MPAEEGAPGSNVSMTRTGLPPGKYNIALMQMPGYAVSSMTLNGAPMPPGATVDLESPESVLTYVLTTQLGSVTGTVRDSDQQAVPDATVVLAPDSLADTGDDRLSLPPGMGESVISDGGGRFTFSGLAPGRYKAVALKDGDRRRAINGASIRERMKAADVVVVSPRQSTNLELTVGK